MRLTKNDFRLFLEQWNNDSPDSAPHIWVVDSDEVMTNALDLWCQGMGLVEFEGKLVDPAGRRRKIPDWWPPYLEAARNEAFKRSPKMRLGVMVVWLDIDRAIGLLDAVEVKPPKARKVTPTGRLKAMVAQCK